MMGNLPTYRVLVVDDEEMIRRLIVRILSKQGQHCETASHGFEALDKIKRDHFDAVITDIEMPKMDGLILTKALLNEYPDLPIMIMTGFTRNYKIGNAMAVGARDFIKKPFPSSELILRFKIMMRDQETRLKIELKKATGSMGPKTQIQEKILQLRMQLETRGSESLLSINSDRL
jgi:CheY-like chemotaxis protein